VSGQRIGQPDLAVYNLSPYPKTDPGGVPETSKIEFLSPTHKKLIAAIPVENLEWWSKVYNIEHLRKTIVPRWKSPQSPIHSVIRVEV
jgi:hypothetical protein